LNELEKIGVQVDEDFNYSIIENEILDIDGLSANKKLFLVMLRRYAGHNNKPSWPSYSKLMKTTGIKSDDTITKCIKFFEWLCFLEKVNRKKENGEKDTNLYIISIKNIRTVLQYFSENNVKIAEVEKYFDDRYKENKCFPISEPCKFFKVS
jgi:hypothetical protein